MKTVSCIKYTKHANTRLNHLILYVLSRNLTVVFSALYFLISTNLNHYLITRSLARFQIHNIFAMSSPSESRPASPLPDEPVPDHEDPIDAPITTPTANADDDDLSDNDSILSDVDEAQFEDFDPANVAIDRPPVPVHEGNLKLIGRHKRKRDGDQADEGGKRKKREGKREKSRKSAKRNDDDDDFSGGQEVEGKRIRKKKSGTEGGSSGRRDKIRGRKATPENEESLTPEERQ